MRLFPRYAVCFACGVAAGAVAGPLCIEAAYAVVCSGLLLILLSRFHAFFRSFFVRAVLVIFLGMCRFSIAVCPETEEWIKGESLYAAEVLKKRHDSDNASVLRLRMKGRATGAIGPDSINMRPVSLNAWITVMSGDVAAGRGDFVLLRTDLGRFRRNRNPPRIRKQNRAFFSGIVERGENMMILEEGFQGFDFLNEWKLRVRQCLSGYMSGQSGAVASTMILGESGSLSKSTRDLFRDAGIAHLLAISGLHTGIIAWLLLRFFMLVIPVGALKGHRNHVSRISPALVITVIWAYVLMAGSGPSTVRAGLMISMFMCGSILGRPGAWQEALAASAVVLLVADPLSIVDAGFQLTYAATVSIGVTVSMTGRAGKQPGRFESVRSRIFLLFCCSAAATAATAPFVSWHFGGFSCAGVLANLLAIPVVSTLIMPVLCLALFIGPVFPTLMELPLGFVDYAICLMIKSARLFSHLDCFYIDTSLEYAPFTAVLVSAVIFFLLLRNRFIAAVASACLLIMISAVRLHDGMNNSRNMEAVFLDVGHGDAVLLRMPGEKNILIDGGGESRESSFDTGRRITLPALGSLGVSDLDVVVSTHAHVDHYRGLDAVIDGMRVMELWHNAQGEYENASPGYEDLLEKARKMGVRLMKDRSYCVRRYYGRAWLRVVWPCLRRGYDPSLGLNDNSLVLEAGMGKVRFLFTGDIESDGEGGLLRRGFRGPMDILKVAHHGSRGSSTKAFLDAVKPRIAVVSSGRSRGKEPPHADALERLADSGAAVLETRRLGAVRILTDGETVKAGTFSSPSLFNENSHCIRRDPGCSRCSSTLKKSGNQSRFCWRTRTCTDRF